MTVKEFQEYNEASFISFCRTVIHREGVNIFRELADLAAREITFSTLSENEMRSLCTTDTYELYCRKFPVRGNIIQVHDCDLGQAIGFLNHKQRDALLLHYFLGYSDSQIGCILHIGPDAVRYRRTKALKNLKSIMEEIENE